MVDLLNALEDELGVQVDLAKVTPENFATPQKIAAFLRTVMVDE